jgi:hypothetical protein
MGCGSSVARLAEAPLSPREVEVGDSAPAAEQPSSSMPATVLAKAAVRQASGGLQQDVIAVVEESQQQAQQAQAAASQQQGVPLTSPVTFSKLKQVSSRGAARAPAPGAPPHPSLPAQVMSRDDLVGSFHQREQAADKLKRQKAVDWLPEYRPLSIVSPAASKDALVQKTTRVSIPMILQVCCWPAMRPAMRLGLVRLVGWMHAGQQEALPASHRRRASSSQGHSLPAQLLRPEHLGALRPSIWRLPPTLRLPPARAAEPSRGAQDQDRLHAGPLLLERGGHRAADRRGLQRDALQLLSRQPRGPPGGAGPRAQGGWVGGQAPGGRPGWQHGGPGWRPG